MPTTQELSWTVFGDDHLPIPPVDAFLAYLSDLKRLLLRVPCPQRLRGGRPAGHRRNISRRRYKPFLHHISKERPARILMLRIKAARAIPDTLTPPEVQPILDPCDRLRDRFLLALLRANHSSSPRTNSATRSQHGW
ncbi:MAG: hypothetical protein ACRDJO_02255 [Actinomycetota bacterium]